MYNYVITFDSYGGQGFDADRITITSGDSITIPLGYPSMDNHWFLGWTINPTTNEGIISPGETLSYDDIVVLSEELGGTTEITLYAAWEMQNEKYTIEFDPTGGNFSYSSVSDYGGVSIPLEIPTREGYNFLYWTDGWNNYNPGDGLGGNTTLYAVWESLESSDSTVYTITFEMNDGYYLLGEEDFLYTIADLPKTLIIPSKDGCLFEGWYTTPDFSGNALESLDICMGDITLYAKWQEEATPDIPEEPDPVPDLYVYFLTDDIDVEGLPDPLCIYGCTAVIPETIPTRPGYSFAGWEFDPGIILRPGETLDAAIYGRTIYLYATWTRKGTQTWIKVDGVWKKGLLFVKARNNWKQGNLKIKVEGSWGPNTEN